LENGNENEIFDWRRDDGAAIIERRVGANTKRAERNEEDRNAADARTARGAEQNSSSRGTAERAARRTTETPETTQINGDGRTRQIPPLRSADAA